MAKAPETMTIDEIEAALDERRFVRPMAELIHSWLHPEPSPGSVSVRIAVGFDDDGNWIADGWNGAPDKDVLEEIGDDYKHRTTWIEADIPPPVLAPGIRGRVATP